MNAAERRPAFQFQTFLTRTNITGTMTAAMIGGTHRAADIISDLVDAPVSIVNVVVIQLNIGPQGINCPVGYRVIASNQA